jgi:hypothetical protein
MSSELADVTICITAYKSGAMIKPTLASVCAQSFRNFRVLISIDGPDSGTEEICRSYLDDSRFEIVVQPARLGWVGNTNALLDRVSTEFFFILPHDDIIRPQYIETLRRQALARPDVINTYSDLEIFGSTSEVKSTTGLDGPLFSRVRNLLASPHQAVPWRGLTRRSVLDRGVRMQHNECNGYNSHITFILAQLCLGPFHRVADALYLHRTRADEDSVRVGFRSWSSQQQYEAMTAFMAQCVQTVAAAEVEDRRQHRALVELLLLHHSTLKATQDALRAPGQRAGDYCTAAAADLLARVVGIGSFSAQDESPLDPDDSLSPWRAKLLVMEAREALVRKDLVSAEGAIDTALERDPQNGDAHWTKGTILTRFKRYPEAVVALKTSAALLPPGASNARVRLEISALLERMGDIDGAVAEAEAAVSMAAGHLLGKAYVALSRLLALQGRAVEAISASKRALEIAPDEPKFRSHAETLMRAHST